MQRNAILVGQAVVATIGLVLLFVPDALIAFLGFSLFAAGTVGPLLFVAARNLDSRGRNLNKEPISKLSNVDGLEGISWQYARRVFFWWCTGLTVFVLFYGFLAIRLYVFDPGRLAIDNLITTPGAVAFGSTILVIGLVFSLPLGYLLHQMHIAAYWSRILPIRFTKVDRAYDALITLKNELSIAETFFDRPIVAATFPSHPLLSRLFGRDVQYIGLGWSVPEPIRIAQRNIESLDTLWRKLAQKTTNLGMAQQHVIQLNEDQYVAVGVTRLSVWLAYVLYVFYETAQWRAGYLPSEILAISVLLSTTATLALFWSLNKVRTLLGEGGIGLLVQGIREIVHEYPIEAHEVLAGGYELLPPPDTIDEPRAPIPATLRL